MNAIEKIINNEPLENSEINRTLTLPKEFRSNGFIYVLSNPSMQGIYKIGMTVRNVEERVKELSRSTSIPTPFKIEAVFHSENPLRDEQDIHQALTEFRVSEGREFFRCELSEILDCCDEFCSFRTGVELSHVAASYDVICLSEDEEILDAGEFIPYSCGNRNGMANFLQHIGGRVVDQYLKENDVSLVIFPNNDVEFVRSIYSQFHLGEIQE